MIGLLVGTAPINAGTTRISLLPDYIESPLGARFTTDVHIDSKRPLKGYEIVLIYDPELLALESVNEAEFSGGPSIGFVLIDSAGGRISVTRAAAGADAFLTGVGTICTLGFRGIGEGEGMIDVARFDLRDSDLKPVPAVTQPSAYMIGSVTRMETAAETRRSPVGFQNYPNPFNEFTVLEFKLPATGIIEIEIFDLPGKRIIGPVTGTVPESGTHRHRLRIIDWPSGVYFCRFFFTESVSGRMYGGVRPLMLLR